MVVSMLVGLFGYAKIFTESGNKIEVNRNLLRKIYLNIF